MHDDNLKLRIILAKGSANKDRSAESRQRVYEILKQELHKNLLFGYEKELADVLNI